MVGEPDEDISYASFIQQTHELIHIIVMHVHLPMICRAFDKFDKAVRSPVKKAVVRSIDGLYLVLQVLNLGGECDLKESVRP